MFTPYIDQMNKIIERISWSKILLGELINLNLMVFQHLQISEFEGERIIKTTFDLSMKGYLLPESFNSIVNTQKEYSKRIN